MENFFLGFKCGPGQSYLFYIKATQASLTLQVLMMGKVVEFYILFRYRDSFPQVKQELIFKEHYSA